MESKALARLRLDQKAPVPFRGADRPGTYKRATTRGPRRCSLFQRAKKCRAVKFLSAFPNGAFFRELPRHAKRGALTDKKFGFAIRSNHELFPFRETIDQRSVMIKLA